jgi:hypothetical protein
VHLLTFNRTALASQTWQHNPGSSWQPALQLDAEGPPRAHAAPAAPSPHSVPPSVRGGMAMSTSRPNAY